MTDRVTDVWRYPLLLGTVSAAGLVGALLGDGWTDRLACVALSVPVVVCLWGLLPIGANQPRSQEAAQTSAKTS